MEHESFEDPEVAALMNRHLVAVKVDREERPDIDDVYMAVCHLMGKRGGWPLTILMTPDKRPFYAGTYIPKHSRFGRIGMMDLVPRVAELWEKDRVGVERSATEITAALRSQSNPVSGDAVGAPADGGWDIPKAWVHEAVRSLRGQFDADFGGFGGAPKFPSPHTLSFLFRFGRQAADAFALEMARDTMLAMWRGGVFDQVGFGFHRYSTDREWRLPHFEKMLYDQATMLEAAVDGYLATGDDRLRQLGLETADYLLRDLRHPQGGFYSAEDADSEGEEGLFYTWTHAELSQVLSGSAFDEAVNWFGVETEGNFEDEATGRKTGRNVLHPGQGDPPDELPALRAALLSARAGRVRPLRDEKILLDWNGLAIGALARAGRVFRAAELIDAAVEAAGFLRQEMRSEEGWLHRWFEGDAAVPAMLDDLAFLGGGLVELFLATSDPQHLEDAIELAGAMLACHDAPDGGLFRASTRGEELLSRRQEWYDGAMPAGVSAAVRLLLDLGALTSEAAWSERAARLIGPASVVLRSAPSALTGFLAGSVRVWGTAREVVVVSDDPEDRLVREALASGELAFRLPATGTIRERMEALIPAVADMGLVDGRAAAYVCSGFTCERPVTNEEGLRAALGSTEAS